MEHRIVVIEQVSNGYVVEQGSRRGKGRFLHYGCTKVYQDWGQAIRALGDYFDEWPSSEHPLSGPSSLESGGVPQNNRDLGPPSEREHRLAYEGSWSDMAEADVDGPGADPSDRTDKREEWW